VADSSFVSLITILQNPDRFDGQKVKVIGFASLTFEGKALYVSEEAYRAALTKNGVWLSTELDEAKRKLHEKFVLVEGTFDAKSLGHLKMFSGTIREITRLERWSEPAKPKDAPPPPPPGGRPTPPAAVKDDWSPPDVPMPGARPRR
jgi:hypothetical protein